MACPSSYPCYPRATATAPAPTYASVVTTVARLEVDRLVHAEMDQLRGSRGRGSRGGTVPPWRSHRRPRAREGPRPWPPRPD